MCIRFLWLGPIEIIIRRNGSKLEEFVVASLFYFSILIKLVKSCNFTYNALMGGRAAICGIPLK
jgi:hypothetical protein